VGLILDVAVAALALAVIGSLGLLAWTLGVPAVRAVRRGRRDVGGVRARVTDAEADVTPMAARANAVLERVARRIQRHTGDEPQQ